MKSFFSRLPFVFIGLLLAAFFLVAAPGRASAANTITGTIYDNLRNPLQDIDVELLDQYYRLLARNKTSSSGRYEFSNLGDGMFYIRVYAFRYDLEDETRQIDLFSVSGIPGQTGSSYNVEDFYLQPRKGGLRERETSVIYAQEVPKEAEKAYKQAVDDFQKKREAEGFANVQEALRIFPTYYQALQLFGRELLVRDRFMDAAQVFMKAVEVNPRSGMSLYYIGLCFSKLGTDYYKAALTALREAAKQAPESASVLFLMGTIERSLGRYQDAEKHLLEAKRKSKSKNPELLKELAQLYANDLKRYADAAETLEEYITATQMPKEEAAKTRQVIANLRTKAQQQTGN
jgi:tetratricopeptide (TPR) repeat protein